MTPPRPLEHFSTGALVRELELRADGITQLRRIKRWCEDCVHWRYTTSERDMRNNCTREHVMSFRAPDAHDWPERGAWGFYRRGCADWCARPEPDDVVPVPGVPVIPPAPPPRPPRGSRSRRAK